MTRGACGHASTPARSAQRARHQRAGTALSPDAWGWGPTRVENAPREKVRKEIAAMSARHILRGCSVACAVWFAFAIVAAAEKPDFTGRWRIDSAKSTHSSTPLKNPEPNAPPPPPPPPPPDPN